VLNFKIINFLLTLNLVLNYQKNLILIRRRISKKPKIVKGCLKFNKKFFLLILIQKLTFEKIGKILYIIIKVRNITI
jgi:hypothetical protein